MGLELSFLVSSDDFLLSSAFGTDATPFFTSLPCSWACSSPSWRVSFGRKLLPTCFSIECIPSLLRRRRRSGECMSFTSVTDGARGSGVFGLFEAVSFFSLSKLWMVFGSRASRSSAFCLLSTRPVLPVVVVVTDSRSVGLVSRLRSRVRLCDA